jgi:hypothetical protein
MRGAVLPGQCLCCSTVLMPLIYELFPTSSRPDQATQKFTNYYNIVIIRKKLILAGHNRANLGT